MASSSGGGSERRRDERGERRPDSGRAKKAALGKISCNFCEVGGHYSMDCPEVRCHRCLDKGHIAVACANPARCRFCGVQDGHESRDCIFRNKKMRPGSPPSTSMGPGEGSGGHMPPPPPSSRPPVRPMGAYVPVSNDISFSHMVSGAPSSRKRPSSEPMPCRESAYVSGGLEGMRSAMLVLVEGRDKAVADREVVRGRLDRAATEHREMMERMEREYIERVKRLRQQLDFLDQEVAKGDSISALLAGLQQGTEQVIQTARGTWAEESEDDNGNLCESTNKENVELQSNAASSEQSSVSVKTGDVASDGGASSTERSGHGASTVLSEQAPSNSGSESEPGTIMGQSLWSEMTSGDEDRLLALRISDDNAAHGVTELISGSVEEKMEESGSSQEEESEAVPPDTPPETEEKPPGTGE